MNSQAPEQGDLLVRWTAMLEDRLAVAVASREVTLPPYPAVALKVQELLARNAGMAEVARSVGADSALATDVLRCANSAMYRRGGGASNLTQAITQIGTQQVMRLALASGLAARTLSSGPLAPLRRACWIEGLASAAVCQELARLRHLPADKAFLLGLIHDFGKIVALASLESICERVHSRYTAPAEAFLRLVESHHVELAVALARRWSFPDPLREVIAAHHGEGTVKEVALLGAVIASDQVVALLRQGPAVMAADLASKAGLNGLDEVNAVRHLVVQIPEFVAAFEPETLPRDEAGSAVARPGPREIRPLATAFPVQVVLARKVREYRAVALDERAIVVEGSDSLPENRLIELTLLGAQDSFGVWTLPRGMQAAEDGSIRIELQPYALDGVSQARWAALARSSAG
jgi:HD-like signal output (HDOD) protein